MAELMQPIVHSHMRNGRPRGATLKKLTVALLILTSCGAAAKEPTSSPSPWAEPTPEPDAERVVFEGRLTNDFFFDDGSGRKDDLVGFTLKCPLPKANTTTTLAGDQIVWLRMDRDYAGVTLEHLRVRHRERLPLRVVGLEVVGHEEILANRIVDA
jgi:hypothetical protein